MQDSCAKERLFENTGNTSTERYFIATDSAEFYTKAVEPIATNWSQEETMKLRNARFKSRLKKINFIRLTGYTVPGGNISFEIYRLAEGDFSVDR